LNYGKFVFPIMLLSVSIRFFYRVGIYPTDLWLIVVFCNHTFIRDLSPMNGSV